MTTTKRNNLKNLTACPPYVTLPEEWEPAMGYPISGVPTDGGVWPMQIDPPAVGQKVNVTDLNMGLGTVTGFCVVEGWVGVYVEIDAPPAWWVERKGGKVDIFFGPSLEY